MKKLVMGTHWDALNLPEGAKHFSHKHDWRVNNEVSKTDPLGRPYCTVCGGKPSFYDLYEISEEEVEGYINGGRCIIVERDSSFDTIMGCTVRYDHCSKCSGTLGQDATCVCVMTEKIQEALDELGITDWWITGIKCDYKDTSDYVVVEDAAITFDKILISSHSVTEAQGRPKAEVEGSNPSGSAYEKKNNKTNS